MKHLPSRFLPAVAAVFLLLYPVSVSGSDAVADGPGWTDVPEAVRTGFGSSVALAGDYLFVGNPGLFSFFPMPPNRAGVVNVFHREADGSWTEMAAIASPGDEVGDAFGTAVAARGDWLAVGAPGAGDGAGAAYLFRRDGDRFALVATMEGGDAGDAAGTSVALSGDRYFIGVPGADDGAGLVWAATLTMGDLENRVLRAAEPLPDARFGAALSARGDALLVGAPGPAIDPFAGPLGIEVVYQPGSAHLFRMDDGGADPVAVLRPAAETPAGFGWAVALGDGQAFVGAPLGNGGAGSVTRWAPGPDGSWSLSGTLSPGETQVAGLGMSLAWNGRELVAGAPMMSTAVVFVPGADGSLTPGQILQEFGGQASFGSALALDEGVLVTGAPGASIFAGLGVLYRSDGGEFTRAGTLASEETGPAPITGETVACAEDGTAGAFPCGEVDLVAFLPTAALGADRGIMVNDLWGWTDAETGREYAVVGRNDGTVFVDVTDAANPRMLGELPLSDTAVPSLWRDMKVYADHAFIVADAAGQHGMQIFDLRELRGLAADPDRVFEETARYGEIYSAHNIFINEDTGFAYVVGSSSGGTTCGGGLHMVDIRDPVNPEFVGCFQDMTTGNTGTGQSHDVQCVLYHGPDEDYAGSEICLGSNETALSIADVTDKANPVAVSTARYPNSSYVHQGWLSEDHRFFFMNDEGDEIAGLAPRTRTLVWDVQDLDDPVLLTEHLGTTAASDHNLYIDGNLMYQSNYVSGLRILDVSDPANPVEIGYFDTVPQGENGPGFAGSWSNYPFFESGTIIVTSLREGLFILKRKEQRAVLD